MLRRLLLLVCVTFITGCLADEDPQSIKGREYEIAALFTVIENALEKNDGVLDLTEFTKNDDWDQFCLIMAYHGGSEYMIGGVDRLKEIEKIYPGNREASFGLGIFFLKDEAISEAIQIPSFIFPEDYVVGKNLRKIMEGAGVNMEGAGAKFALHWLSPEFEKLPTDPKGICYSKDKTIKIGFNWKYTIVDLKE